MDRLRRTTDALHRRATVPALLLATAAYALFLATVMPQQSAASRAYAGDWGAPDRQFFYTPDELYEQLPRWGEAGRRDYIEFRLGLDIAWALVYTGFLVTAIGCASRRAFAAGDRRRLLIFAPLPAMLCDYAENALGIFLVASFPQRHDALAMLAALVTTAKWLTLVAAHAVLLYTLAAALGARLRGAQ